MGTICEAKVGTYNLETKASKCKVFVRVGKHGLGASVGKYKFGLGLINTNWGQGWSTKIGGQGR